MMVNNGDDYNDLVSPLQTPRSIILGLTSLVLAMIIILILAGKLKVKLFHESVFLNLFTPIAMIITGRYGRGQEEVSVYDRRRKAQQWNRKRAQGGNPLLAWPIKYIRGEIEMQSHQ